MKTIKDQRSVKVLRVTDPENSLHMGRDFLLHITNQTAETARLPSNTEPGTQANAYNAIPILCGGKGSAEEKNFLSILGLPSLPFYIPELNVGDAESTYNFADRAPLICNGDKDGELVQTESFENGANRNESWLVKNSPVTGLDQVYSLGCNELVQALGYRSGDASAYEKNVFLDIYGEEIVDINCNLNAIASEPVYHSRNIQGKGLLIRNEGPNACRIFTS